MSENANLTIGIKKSHFCCEAPGFFRRLLVYLLQLFCTDLFIILPSPITKPDKIAAINKPKVAERNQGLRRNGRLVCSQFRHIVRTRKWLPTKKEKVWNYTRSHCRGWKFKSFSHYNIRTRTSSGFPQLLLHLVHPRMGSCVLPVGWWAKWLSNCFFLPKSV